MAYTGNVAQAYSHNETTVREDLQDYLTIASPVDMPLFSLLSTRPITQRQFEWAVDDIVFDDNPANIAGDTSPEGKDATFVTHVPRNRIYNFAQINALSVDTSDTSRVVEMAGVPDEYVYQLWKKLLEIGRIMDMAAHFGTGADHTGDQSSASGRVTHGLFNWIATLGYERTRTTPSTTKLLFTGGPTINDEFYSSFYDAGVGSPPVGVDISRAILFENILAPAWRNGFIVAGAVGLCGARLKKIISDFTLVANGPLNHRHIPARLNMLIDTIDVIETPLGRVYINMDRYMDISRSITFTGALQGSPPDDRIAPINESILFIDPEYFRIAVLRGLGFKPLADLGDSSKGMLVGEWGLQVDNPIYGCGGTNLD